MLFAEGNYRLVHCCCKNIFHACLAINFLPVSIPVKDDRENDFFVPCLQVCHWSIGRIPKDKAPSLSGTLQLETGLDRLHVFPTFEVGFKIMGVPLSGLQIDKLDIKNMPNPPYKGFRFLTRAGEYEIRS